jgi:hypothetical protein
MTLFLIWILNLALTALNLFAVGKTWAKATATGGWSRFSVWMTAVQSASILSLGCLLLATSAMPMLFSASISNSAVALALAAWVLFVHPVLLLTGFGMFTESLVAAVRGKGIASWTVVAFNAYVTWHNWSRALPIFSELFNGPAHAIQAPAEAIPMLSVVVAIMSLILALGIGITMTVFMIRKAARKEFSHVMRRAA